MPEEKKIKKEKTIEQRIKAEKTRLQAFFKSLPDDKKKFIDKQIHQLAVIQVTLERLVDELNNSEILDDFEQGTQHFKRENPALKSYNTTMKSYIALAKQLCDMLPKQESSAAGQAIMSFATKPKSGSK